MQDVDQKPVDLVVESRSWSELVWAAEHDRAVISRANQRGTLRRLAPGLYTGVVDEEPAQVVRRHLLSIVARELPGAVIVDRTARSGGVPTNGILYVAHPRTRPLALPGATVVPRRGANELEGDIALPDGIHLASPARTMLESLAFRNAGRLTRDEIESWIDHVGAHDGSRGLNSIRDTARRIAPQLRAHKAFEQLDRLISAALTTGDVRDTTTPALRARAEGSAFDAVRARRFESLAEFLRASAPRSVLDLPADSGRRQLLSFFEAYFSNFIEGTEFTVSEAARIVFDNEIPPERPADGHDIAGTYAVVTDPAQRSLVARDSDAFVELLRRRHAEVMRGRPEKRPGQLKHIGNRAGATEFVAPDLVDGTLRHAFDVGAELIDPFQRAVFVMFVVAEVHPFLDGNGRLARIMMNAELSAGAQVRLIIPTVFRLDYLAALKAATHNDVFAPMIAVLDFAQRYTARVDFTSIATAQADLTRTNAMRDAYEADQAGVRLTLP